MKWRWQWTLFYKTFLAVIPPCLACFDLIPYVHNLSGNTTLWIRAMASRGTILCYLLLEITFQPISVFTFKNCLPESWWLQACKDNIKQKKIASRSHTWESESACIITSLFTFNKFEAIGSNIDSDMAWSQLFLHSF